MIKSRGLQIGLLTCLTAIFGFSVSWIPNSYGNYNFVALKFGIYIFIAIVVIALIFLAISQSSNNKSLSKKTENAYNKTYKLSLNILIASVIVALSVNITIYLTPLTKNFVTQNLHLIIFFSIIMIIFKYLDKKGLKLLENE